MPKDLVVKEDEGKVSLSDIQFGPSMVAGVAAGVMLTVLFNKFIGPKIIDVKAS